MKDWALDFFDDITMEFFGLIILNDTIIMVLK